VLLEGTDPVTDYQPGLVVHRAEATAQRIPPRPAAAGSGCASVGRKEDIQAPVVVVIHALTGDMVAGGEHGWWAPVVGLGRAIDPSRYNILCFNNLGSCYGTSGAADPEFPKKADDRRFPAFSGAGKGAFREPEDQLPATLTPYDLAASQLMALTALGIREVHAVVGGSLGGMVAMALCLLRPGMFRRLVAVGTMDRSDPWLIGWNHIMRQVIVADPGFPGDVRRGLELARQVGHMTYRAMDGLNQRHGRVQTSDEGRQADPGTTCWSSRVPYRIQTYLEHQGRKLTGRFSTLSYLAQFGATDHHDIRRIPASIDALGDLVEPGREWGLDRLRASTLLIGIETDKLFPPEEMQAMARRMQELGRIVAYREVRSPHGHDAFLIEFDQVGSFVAEGLVLPSAQETGHHQGPSATCQEVVRE
jgi:homoserine O-acetyltransferase